MEKGRVSDKQLINWINRMANTTYETLADLSDGSGYCIVLKKLFPEKMSNFTDAMPKRELPKKEKMNNWRHITKALESLGEKRQIQLEVLVGGDKASNKRFGLWFKEFYRKSQESAEKKKMEKMDKKELTALRRVESTVIAPEGEMASAPSFRVEGISSEFEERMQKMRLDIRRKGDETELILDIARTVKAGHLLNMEICCQNFGKISKKLSKVTKNKKTPVWETYRDLEDCLLYSEEVHDDLKDAVNDIKQNEQIILMYHLMTEMKTAAGMITETNRLRKGIVPTDIVAIANQVIQAYHDSITYVANIVIRIWKEVQNVTVSEENELCISFKSLRAHLKDAADSAGAAMKEKKIPFQTEAEKALWHWTHWSKVTADAILFLAMSGN